MFVSVRSPLVTVAADITRGKIRDGDPGALAALCERRGAAVLAYCEQVADRGHATTAAADAFARLRVAVVAPGKAPRMESDALLRHMVRRAAAWRGTNALAARAGKPVSETCAAEELGLVGYVEKSLPPADRESLDDHLVRCGGCCAALRRLEAGERAYGRPPRAPLPAGVVEELLRALVTVAPVRACGGNAAAVQEEALRLLAAGRAPAAAPAKAAPAALAPEAHAPERRPLDASPRRRPEALRKAAPAEPPAADRASRQPTAAKPAPPNPPAAKPTPARPPAADAPPAAKPAPARPSAVDTAPTAKPTRPRPTAADPAPARPPAAKPARRPRAADPAPPRPPAASPAPPLLPAADPPLPAGAALRLPTLDLRASPSRVGRRKTPVSASVALLAAAAVLGTAAVLWLSSSSGTTLLPTPSAPVSLGGTGDTSSTGNARESAVRPAPNAGASRP